MGTEVTNVTFTDNDFIKFNQKLREETKLLMQWFHQDLFEKPEVPKCGVEVEAWLVDSDFVPYPKSDSFLKQVADPLVVPEISKFNFELNSEPLFVGEKFLSQLHQNLKKTWHLCQQNAAKIKGKVLTIGSLPTLRKHMLTIDQLYPSKRYFALNDRVLKLRDAEDIKVNIKGKEELSEIFKNIMLEAAATSFQIHLQVKPSDAKRFYNASVIISPFMSALCANSPFLFGKTLWSDTRIAIFEQAVDLQNYMRNKGRMARRVTLGNGYIRDSLFELFLDNLDGYPVLLPDVINSDPEELAHLRLHNGTIWRWNRPIIGVSKNGNPHLRIEHRVPASGPTITDMIANMAFYVGLVYAIAEEEKPLENIILFEESRINFYEACKYGFNAECIWRDGKKHNLQSILLHELLPKARTKILELGTDPTDVEYYFDEILASRIRSGQNASNWQRAYINTHGSRFQELLEMYFTHQENDDPVHTWKA
ncbi:MAG: hypothetical protein H6621_12060 [Halobacteriovoraceae bacterium]|nr:hypothetical protein [Halobacteriovoraceae bacterium]MCB9095796.1 hypothetical protein [Halobacteriovoraceae bacterium]